MGRGLGQGGHDGGGGRAALILLSCCLAVTGCERMLLPLTNPFHRPAGDPVPEPQALVEAETIDRLEDLLAKHAWEEAERRITPLLARAPDHPRLLFIKGRLHADRREFAAAASWFERSLAGSPAWIDPRLRLGACYLELERPAAAADVFRDIDELFPEHPAGPSGRALCQLERGRIDLARTLLDEALARDADYPYALRARARVAGLDGDDALEKRLLLRYVVIVPDDPWAHARLGRLHEAAGQPARARRSYRRSFELNPAPDTAERLLALARTAGDQRAVAHWQAHVDGPSDRDGNAVDSIDPAAQFAVPH